jgi:radical SAM protein (TIGR01212 family)
MEWEGKPYFPISHVYRERFGGKVVKVPVSIAETCPNREGLRGMKTCIFCDVHGSFAYPDTQGEELRTQILLHREKVGKRFNAKKFLIYFQAYTTTFTQIARLKAGFATALEFEDVAGIIVGTRPDTLSDGLLKFWQETAEKTFVGIELGVQSFDAEQLIWMRRGHTAEQSVKGIERVAKAGLDVGVHLMFGWPTETDAQIIETAKRCNDLPISNVKLHNLHVLRNTPLELLHASGEFQPIDLDLYSARVALFLDHLSPKIAVHRLAALSSKWDELIAPEWVKHKMRSYQAIIDRINANGSFQGRLFDASNKSKVASHVLPFPNEARP